MVSWKRLGLFVTAMLMLPAVGAWAVAPADKSAEVIAWAKANFANYQQYEALVNSKSKPDVPVPPEVNFPCHVCGDTTQTQGEADVATWLQQSQDPEITAIQGLLAIEKQLILYRQYQQASANFSYALSSEADDWLAKFRTENEIDSDVGGELVISRLYDGKADKMAAAYGEDPTRAYAGITFLNAVNKLVQVLGKDPDRSMAEQNIQQLTSVWAQSIANKINDDIVSGHQYNLCPVYTYVLRVAEMLTNTSMNMAQVTELLQKLQSLMTFNVSFNMSVKSQQNDGSHMDATWSGQAKLILKLNTSDSCYTPQWDKGGTMPINVTWEMVSMEKQQNGTVIPDSVLLTSPHSFNAQIDPPIVNLCDPDAVFQLPLGSMKIPQEAIFAKGYTKNGAFMVPFLNTVIAANELNIKATNAVTGGAQSATGGANAPVPIAGSASSAQAQAKALVMQHAGDPSWFMSPDGQAALKQMQQQAMGVAQQSMANAGVILPDITDMSQLSTVLMSAHMLWMNGVSIPVAKTMHTTKGDNNITLEVTVRQAPQ